MNRFYSIVGYGALLMLCSHVTTAHAALTVTGTRFVYKAYARELTVHIGNNAEVPILAQTWLDHGEIDQDPSGLNVPFVVSNPLIRLDPRQQRTLQIRYTGEPLPTDRETLFWLNVREVPPLPQHSDHLLRVSYRMRMKLLFRPQGLSGTADEAAGKLHWREQSHAVEVRNNSPFFITLTALQWGAQGPFEPQQNTTIAPFASVPIPLPESLGNRRPLGQIHYEFVGDNGERVHARAVVHHD